MKTLGLKIRQSWLRREWRLSISRARSQGCPETVVAIIVASARRLDDGAWLPQHALLARELLSGLPGSFYRIRRLNGLLRRLAAKIPKPEKERRQKAAELFDFAGISLCT